MDFEEVFETDGPAPDLEAWAELLATAILEALDTGDFVVQDDTILTTGEVGDAE